MRKTSLCAAIIAFSAPVFAAEAPTGQPDAPRAIECVAAFELMSRAAPQWSAQSAAMTASNAWRTQLAYIAANVTVNTDAQVQQEMANLAEAAVANPDIITTRAMQCVADAPDL